MLRSLIIGTVAVGAHAQPRIDWIVEYDGPDHLYDYASEVAVDPLTGDVVASGRSWTPGIHDWATLRVDPDGVLLWAERTLGVYEPNDLVIDAKGRAIVTGAVNGPFSNAKTIVYQADGSVAWTDVFAGPVWDDNHAAAVAPDGDVVVSGYSEPSLQNNPAMATHRYSSDGEKLWSDLFWVGEFPQSSARDVAVNANGDAVVVGSTWFGAGDGETRQDWTLRMLDSAGDEIWVTHLDGGFEWNDVAFFVGIDSESEIVAFGNEQKVVDEAVLTDAVVIKLNADGIPLWKTRLEVPNGTTSANPVGMVMQTDGSVTVAATTVVQEPFTVTVVTARIDAEGGIVWNTHIPGPFVSWGLAVDAEGATYLAGNIKLGDGAYDGVMLKLDEDGNVAWTEQFDWYGLNDSFHDIAVDVDGGLVVAGVIGVGEEEGDGNMVVVRYDLAGCPADINGDGGLNVLDFVAFQLLWQAHDPAADCDANAEFNVLDFVCYQQLFIAGCP
jgi:hypothetical protein